MKIVNMSRLLPLSLALFICLMLKAQSDTTIYHTVSKGKIKGTEKKWKTGSNEYQYSFWFNDRGRGDSIQSTIHLNESGSIIFIDTKGVDYYKSPYTENLSIVADSIVWSINGDRKTKKLGNQFYSPNNPPSSIDLLVKWLIKQPGMKGDNVPDGTIHMDEPISKTIHFHNQSIQLKLIALYFDPSPTPLYIWTTENLDYFASVSEWTSIIKEGYENWTDSLMVHQLIASTPFYQKQIDENSNKLALKITITHANLFNSETATVEKNRSIDIQDGKIKAIYASTTNSGFKADTLIDAKGKFLMPGLWDMHGHFSKEEGIKYLSGGVTHLRDLGNDKILLQYKKQIDENQIMAPEISYMMGFIDKEDPFEGPTGTMINSVEEGIKGIDEYHKLGYKAIKFYSAMKPAWIAPLSAHAHQLGMRICGHIPAFMTAAQAIKAGYDEITHMNFILLNFQGDTVDTRTPARFRLVGERGGNLDLSSKAVKDFVKLMKDKKIALDPTMNVWQGMFAEFKGDTSHVIKPILNWIPDEWLQNITIQTPFGSDENKAAYKASFAKMMEFLKILYDNGILLVAGTDGGEAFALHNELALYVQAGIPSNQVLKIATYNAALACNLEKTAGTIKIGNLADLILIDGDPSINISDIRRVELVIKNKRLYQPKKLMATQGMKYYY